MSTTQGRFTEAEKVILFAWWAEKPELVRTESNARQIGDYLEWNKLKATLTNIEKAYQDLRAAGRLEITKTPAQLLEEKHEAARQRIYAEAAAKLAEGSRKVKLDFTNPVVKNKIAKWLHTYADGQMTTELVLKACYELRNQLPFEVDKPSEYQNRTDGTQAQGRKNHAADNTPEAARAKSPLEESAIKGAVALAKIKGDEAETQRQVAENAINGYIAVRAGRVSQSQTDSIRQLLRKVAAKRGPLVAIEILNNMPDDARTESYIQARL